MKKKKSFCDNDLQFVFAKPFYVFIQEEGSVAIQYKTLKIFYFFSK